MSVKTIEIVVGGLCVCVALDRTNKTIPIGLFPRPEEGPSPCLQVSSVPVNLNSVSGGDCEGGVQIG